MKLNVPGEGRSRGWQEAMLDQLVEPAFVKEDPHVKGPFTSGDYVTWLLNLIFGPDGWSSTAVEPPHLEVISPVAAYVQCVVRLTATFADGAVATHDGPGVCLLYATKAKQGGTLEETSPEQYEMAIKGSETDGLKAAAERFGTCFRPLLDKALAGMLERKHAAERMHTKVGKLDESAEKSNDDLFGEEPEDVAAKSDPLLAAAEEMGGKVADESIADKPDFPRGMVELYEMAEARGIEKPEAIRRIMDGTELDSVKEALNTGWTAPELWEKCFSDLS